MKREEAFDALSGLDDTFIAEAIRYAPAESARPPERIAHVKKRIITLALAAVLILALSVTAYAAISAMSHRIPDPEETFRITWNDGPGGYIEWTDAKLVVTFPDTAESKEIEFRSGWLPEEMASLQTDDWRGRLTAEKLCRNGGGGNKAVPAYDDMVNPLQINVYSASQFNNGGAMLLLYYTPEEIIEEHWDELNVDVMRFHTTQLREAIPEIDLPERTLVQDQLILFNPEAGWIIRICGEIGMDQLIKVAQNLEIRETGRVLTYDDFESHYLFIDGGVG